MITSSFRVAFAGGAAFYYISELIKRIIAISSSHFFLMEEQEGFEPSHDSRRLSVFKTVPFGLLGTVPYGGKGGI